MSNVEREAKKYMRQCYKAARKDGMPKPLAILVVAAMADLKYGKWDFRERV